MYSFIGLTRYTNESTKYKIMSIDVMVAIKPAIAKKASLSNSTYSYL